MTTKTTTMTTKGMRRGGRRRRGDDDDEGDDDRGGRRQRGTTTEGDDDSRGTMTTRSKSPKNDQVVFHRPKQRERNARRFFFFPKWRHTNQPEGKKKRTLPCPVNMVSTGQGKGRPLAGSQATRRYKHVSTGRPI